MLSSLGIAALFGILGTLAAVAWTFVLRLAALPGAALGAIGTRADRVGVVRTGVGLTFLLDAFLLLTFAALVVRTVGMLLDRNSIAPSWPLWMAGSYLAVAPVLFGGKDLPGAAARDATDTAFAFALPLAGLGYWTFVVWPEVLVWGWGWLPHVRF
jgi:hypothetical protein